jgi:hypothetical protein
MVHIKGRVAHRSSFVSERCYNALLFRSDIHPGCDVVLRLAHIEYYSKKLNIFVVYILFEAVPTS